MPSIVASLTSLRTKFSSGWGYFNRISCLAVAVAVPFLHSKISSISIPNEFANRRIFVLFPSLAEFPVERKAFAVEAKYSTTLAYCGRAKGKE